MNWKCIAAATLAVGSLIQPRDAGATTPQSLEVEEILFPGQALRSTDCRYILKMQDDGNLVVYNVTTWQAIWSSSTVGTGGYLMNWANGYNSIFGWDDVTVMEFGLWGTGAHLDQTNNGEVISQNSSTLYWRSEVSSSTGLPNCNNSPPSVAKTQLYTHKNLSGADYDWFEAPQYSHCGYYCAVDSYCDGWTYYQGWCWLKHGPLPSLSTLQWAYSGIIERSP